MKGRFTYLFFAAAIFFCALLASGLGFYPSLKLALLIFGFSAPTYWLLSDSKVKRVSLTLALFFSVVATTLLGALLFAFTPISSLGELVPFLGALVFLLVALKFRSKKVNVQTKEISTQETYGIVSTMLLLVPAAFVLNRSYPVSNSDPYWLPDDFPFFALLAGDVSNGISSEIFFSGVSINYHWLTYAFFGGVNRVAEIDQLQGLVVIPPVLGWLLLALGAVGVAKILSNLRSAAVLAVVAVLFANSVGLAPYATSSLGGTIVSPSTLLTSSWFLASVLITFLIVRSERISFLQAPLMLVLGFSLTLGKISTAVVSVLAISAVIVFNCIHLKPRFSLDLAKFTKTVAVLVIPFIIGIGIVRLLFLTTTETPIGIEGSLSAFQYGNLTLWLVALLPVTASVFSFFVMVAPTMLDTKRIFKVDLVFVSAVLALFGLTMIFVFDFGAGNEAWFLVASLALILPTSSVAVANVFKDHLSTKFGGRILQLLTVAGVSIASAIGLLFLRNNSVLEVRPWLLPAILVAIFLVFGSAFAVLGDFRARRSSLMAIIRLSFAGMFLLSLVFGIFLRTEVGISSFQGRQGVSALRDEWLSESKDLIDSLGTPQIESPLAIYSKSPAEATLTRWIPYFSDSPVYNLNPNDSITDYFTPREQLIARQTIVKNFVEYGDPEACQNLKTDGVEWVWVTEGLDLTSEIGVITKSPTLIKVECDALTSQP